MTQRSDDPPGATPPATREAKEGRAAAREAIGKLIGDDAQVRAARAERDAARPKGDRPDTEQE